MAEDREVPPLREEAAKKARETRADLFLRKAREARAKADIEEEYRPDGKFNKKVDSYINEAAVNLGDRLSGEQKEFLGTLLFTAAEREDGAEWVSEGERRIDDKSLDEARLAAILVINEVEAERLPGGMKGKVKELQRNIGKYSKEETAELVKAIEEWKNEKGRTPLEIKAYEEWSKRWNMISQYNESLHLSESLIEETEPAKPVVEEPVKGRWERFRSWMDKKATRLFYFDREPLVKTRLEEAASVAEGETRESELSRALASLAESRDALAWGSARLASQRAELAKRVEKQMEEEGIKEVPEEETVEQAKARAEKEERELFEEEKKDLEEGEEGGEESLDAFSLMIVEFSKRLKTGDVTSQEVQELLARFFGREVRPAEELIGEAGEGEIETQIPEVSLKEEKEKLEKQVEEGLESESDWLKGKDKKQVLKLLEDLSEGRKGLKELANEMYPGKKDEPLRVAFYKRLKEGLRQADIAKEEELKDTPPGKVEEIFRKAVDYIVENDEFLRNKAELKKYRKRLLWFYFLEGLWDELKAAMRQGLADTAR